MLQYYDFEISKSSTCDLTICDLIDTQSAPAVGDDVTYDLLPPATQTNEIATITSIEVSKFNACDDSFSPIEYTIIPVNKKAGTMTYSVSLFTGTGGLDEEQLVWTDALVDNTNVTKATISVVRSGTTVFTEDFTTLSTSYTSTVTEGTAQSDPTFFQASDIVYMTTTYDNGVKTIASWIMGSIGAGDIGDPSSPAYVNMVVDSSNVYTLDASDCLELVTDLDSFGDWDGIWSVRLKVNYTDASGNARHIITTRCAFVDCDNECDAVKEIAELLSTDPDKATELAFTKQMLEWAMDCHQCCAACDALYLYNNRIKGNCKSC